MEELFGWKANQETDSSYLLSGLITWFLSLYAGNDSQSRVLNVKSGDDRQDDARLFKHIFDEKVLYLRIRYRSPFERIPDSEHRNGQSPVSDKSYEKSFILVNRALRAFYCEYEPGHFRLHFQTPTVSHRQIQAGCAPDS